MENNNIYFVGVTRRGTRYGKKESIQLHNENAGTSHCMKDEDFTKPNIENCNSVSVEGNAFEDLNFMEFEFFQSPQTKVSKNKFQYQTDSDEVRTYVIHRESEDFVSPKNNNCLIELESSNWESPHKDESMRSHHEDGDVQSKVRFVDNKSVSAPEDDIETRHRIATSFAVAKERLKHRSQVDQLKECGKKRELELLLLVQAEKEKNCILESYIQDLKQKRAIENKGHALEILLLKKSRLGLDEKKF